MPVRERINALVTQYGLPAGTGERLARLLEALAAEPDPYTTISDPFKAVDHHIADSFSALEIPAVRAAGSLVDIGAGAGFPGLPLAVALPQAQVDLVESARRKCAVIERLATAAEIGNARALAVRAEEWAAGPESATYEVATARAVAPLAVLVEYAAPLLELDGTFVAWKGSRNEHEEAAGRRAGEIVGLRAIEVVRYQPYAGARDLNLHLYLKESETPIRFPRRPGAADKRPLA